MLGKQTPLQKVRGTAKGVLSAEEAERLSPSLRLANFPLLFLGHLLSPRYPKRERLSTSTTHLTGGQKRSVESSARHPILAPRRLDSGTFQASVYSTGRSQKKKKNTQHKPPHTPKTQNKSLYSIFYSVTIRDDFKAIVMCNLEKRDLK